MNYSLNQNKHSLMKKNQLLLSLMILIASVLFTNKDVFAQCKLKATIQNCQSHIKNPYKYNGYWSSEITFDNKAKKIEGHFVAFEGEKYHIVFCNSGFEEDVVVCIYDKSNRAGKDRAKFYDSSTSKEKEYFTFEPSRSGDYYIEYTIPPSKNGVTKTSCVVLVIGAVIDTGSN